MRNLIRGAFVCLRIIARAAIVTPQNKSLPAQITESLERQDSIDLIMLSEGEDQKPEQPQLV